MGSVAPAQEKLTVPAGTPLVVRVNENVRMRVGEHLRGRLVYPVYAEGALVVPKDSIVYGEVVSLHADSSRRRNARLNGDFTPFHTPSVRFTDLVMPDGSSQVLTSEVVTEGAPLFRLNATAQGRGGLIGQGIAQGKQVLRDDIAIFTAPGKGDRLTQFLYKQLPYHPERVEKGTAWTLETERPMQLQAQAEPVEPAKHGSATQTASTSSKPSGSRLGGLLPAGFFSSRGRAEAPAAVRPAPSPDAPPTWTIEAYLRGGLDSATAQTGQRIEATVAKPVWNADHTMAVPVGATLIGTVTRAKPARRFGRTGVLRFDFRELQMPGESPERVQASLTGADAAGGSLSLNSEGEVKSKPKDKVVVPLLLFALASRPLDRDGGDGQFGKSAVGSNGFGLVGRIVGIAASPEAAAGIGYWGTAVAVYQRWIRPGEQVRFARDTRIVLETTPRRSTALQAEVHPGH